MRIFTKNEAKYYCSNYSSITGDSEDSIKQFFRTKRLSTRRSPLTEGTSLFDEYRACSLRDVERNLFLASSQYRRFLDLIIPSASGWAFVTLYYGNWYAAQALLGMFGFRIFTKHFVDVHSSTLGSQKLSVTRINTSHTSAFGSHRKFWDLFYQAVVNLRPVIPSHLVFALNPVSSRSDWQIAQRNDLNYDSKTALKLTEDFIHIFNKANFPNSLPGVLGTQYRVFEAMLEISFSFARQFNLNTDSISSIFGNNLNKSAKEEIYHKKSPNLVSKTKKGVVCNR